MFRALLAAALAFAGAALAQTNAPLQVQLLAPQLIAFSGSSNNFDSLVNGLTTGTPVTLTSVTPDGALQIVTFVPGTTLTPLDAARALESARQNLISLGIATPTGQQLAAALLGGTVTTPSGSRALNGVLTGTTSPTVPVLVRTDRTVPPPTTNLTQAQLQAVRNALATGTSVTLSTANGGAGAQTVEFAATGRRLSDFEVNQALQLAATLLAQQGVLDPSAEQLRVALYGGSLQTLSGARIAVQGVLQGRLVNTSDTRIIGTSDSTIADTSASPTAGASAAAPAPVSPTIGGVPAPGAARTAGGAPIAGQRPAGPIRPGAR